MRAAEGAVDGDAPPRSQAVNSLAQTTEDRATTDPIDRSIPPAMITTAAPTESTPKSATWWSSGWRLYAEKNARLESSKKITRRTAAIPATKPHSGARAADFQNACPRLADVGP